MKNKISILIPVLTVFNTSLLPVPSATAGVRILAQTTTPGSKLTEEIWFEGKTARIDLGRPVKISVLFSGAQPGKDASITQIDHLKKNYATMTESEIRAATTKIRKSKDQLASIMKGLSPGLQKKFGALTGQNKSAHASQQTSSFKYSKTGRTEKPGSYECEVFNGTSPSGKTQTLCFARLVTFGIPSLSAQDFEVAGEMNRFFMTFAQEFGVPEMPNFDPTQARASFGHEGIPVKVSQSAKGKTLDDTLLLEIEKKPAPSSTFLIPSGYQQVSAAQMMTQ